MTCTSCDKGIQQGAVGFSFILTLVGCDHRAVDVSGATLIEFTFKKPSGVMFTAPGSVVSTGTDGRVQYLTVEGDLDEAGSYQYQAYVEVPTGKFWSAIQVQTVLPNL